MWMYGVSVAICVYASIYTDSVKGVTNATGKGQARPVKYFIYI